MRRFTASLLILPVLLVTPVALYQPAYGYQPFPGMYPGQAQPYWQPYQQQQPQPQTQQSYQPQQPYQPYQAQPYPYQQQPYQYQQQPYQQQPYQQQPYQQQPYQQQPYQEQYQRFQPPVIEASVNDLTPYEQQSLIYKIRIISHGNVKTTVPELPQLDSVVLRQLGEPVSESKGSGSETEFTTEYRYLLMPLSAGTIEIPPAKVSGIQATSGGGEGPPYQAHAGQPVILKVRSATEAVQPWLPLYNLQIDAQIRGESAPAAGKPITLEVETKAVGATGSQLPSIAAQLKSEEFRIYPGKSVTDGRISPDGKTLLGRRVESFTLVPQYGGWLKLPDVTINWWNVRYNRPEVAALLTNQLNVSGPSNPNRRLSGMDQAGPLSSAFYWIPLVGAVLVLLYGWMSAFMGRPVKLPAADKLKALMKRSLGELYAPVVALTERITPRRSFHRLRTWTGRRLPVSWKLWFCLRTLAREDDPAEWAHALQILAAKHLGVRPHAHLKYLGKSIAAFHPRANAVEVDALMGELDEAVYGDRPIKSFSRWKREFESQIKPGLFPIYWRRRGTISRRSTTLPQLNPQ